ncbi:MAG: hypothetical protein HYT94_04895 [Parcubacteria group bacterium]|nr:hypothetical protein [Parcubacteria group bacterium]
MQNIIPKKWKNETVYSSLALILAGLWMYAVVIYSNFQVPEIQNESIRANIFLLKEKLYDLGWYYPLMDLRDGIGAYLPGVFFTALIALAFWLGIKSVKSTRTATNSKAARMFSLIPATVSGALLFWIAVIVW